MNFYNKKGIKYYTDLRTELINLVPNNPKNWILEIGAGAGQNLVYLKESGKAENVVGIDIMEIRDSHQQSPLIDSFFVCDIERTPIKLVPASFDILLCGDILEHLNDPWGTLRHLNSFLKSSALLILSIPNFREIKNLYTIIVKGDFNYQPSGILDKTHLRFFCKKNIIQLVKSSGFEILEISPRFLKINEFSKKKFFNRITLGIFKDFLATQYIVVARKEL